MEEKRIDLRIKNEEREEEIKRTRKILFKLNNILPFSKRYNLLLKELFIGGLGKNCYIAAPLYMITAKTLHIGDNVSINPRIIFI